MADNEDHRRNPGLALEITLRACEWKSVGPGLWEKGSSRLLVDHIGVFFYRRVAGCWARTCGLSHPFVIHLPEKVIKFGKNFDLDLITGE